MTPTIRRVVTGHDASARSEIISDSEITFRDAVGGDARFAVIWSTDRSPADNMDETDGGKRDVGLALKGGSVLRYVDIKPGVRSPFHRTISLDYGIVLEGEIVLELDGGKEITVRRGEVVVQRGTIHAWTNKTDQWVRMVFVLLDAEPITINGTTLGDHDTDH